MKSRPRGTLSRSPAFRVLRNVLGTAGFTTLATGLMRPLNCGYQGEMVQYSTVQYSTVQYSTVQYSTVH